MDIIGNKGILVVSLDTELGWGSIENGLWCIREKRGVFTNTRECVKRLLLFLERNNLPCTWAFVGKMIACNNYPEEELLNPPNQTIINALANGDESTFFGDDIFEQVLNSKINHEIAWHSYYHTRFDKDEISKTYAENDLRMAQLIGNKFNLKMKSFVFPQNIGGYYDLCSDYGLKCCRTNELAVGSIAELAKISFRKKLGRYLEAAGLKMSQDNFKLLGRDCYGMKGSMFFKPPRGKASLAPLMKLIALNGLKKAIKDRGYYHIYLHPFNFAEIDGLLDKFTSVLKFAAEERDKGRLLIYTMSDLMKVAMKENVFDKKTDQ